MGDLAAQMIDALGGRANIRELSSCITRLRLVLADPTKMNEQAVKALGALGVIKLGTTVQVVLGTKAERIESEMKALMK
jgi:glucose-like phosphotransferase system IIB component